MFNTGMDFLRYNFFNYCFIGSFLFLILGAFLGLGSWFLDLTFEIKGLWSSIS